MFKHNAQTPYVTASLLVERYHMDGPVARSALTWTCNDDWRQALRVIQRLSPYYEITDEEIPTLAAKLSNVALGIKGPRNSSTVCEAIKNWLIELNATNPKEDTVMLKKVTKDEGNTIAEAAMQEWEKKYGTACASGRKIGVESILKALGVEDKGKKVVKVWLNVSYQLEGEDVQKVYPISNGVYLENGKFEAYKFHVNEFDEEEVIKQATDTFRRYAVQDLKSRIGVRD